MAVNDGMTMALVCGSNVWSIRTSLNFLDLSLAEDTPHKT